MEEQKPKFEEMIESGIERHSSSYTMMTGLDRKLPIQEMGDGWIQ